MCNSTCNLTKKHFIGVLCSFNNDEYNTKNFIIKNWVNGEIIVYTIDIDELFTHISDSIIDNAVIFDSFDMGSNLVDTEGSTSFRVRRVPTRELIKSILDSPTEKQHKMVLAELANRLLMPIMNLILALLCATVLLRSSLLRRRASLAPAIAVASMAAVMAAFMSGSNMITSVTGLGLLAVGQIILLIIIFIVLSKK